MSAQLDILALEPFYGGVRKAMLETVMRCSRHRWTLLKLPPRRMERRLSAAAHWFAEQLSRHWVGPLDILFTSEAMNLADLLRLVPMLEKKPSVVYFHSNQLPDPQVPGASYSVNDLVNLSTAQCAGELWFNSEFHLQDFTRRARALVERHRELSSRDPIPELLSKSRLVTPPIDLRLGALESANPAKRQQRLIFVDTRDADMTLLNLGLATLAGRGEAFELVTVGPLVELSRDFPRSTIAEADEAAQDDALLRAGTFLSAQRGAPSDLYAVRALAADCWPILPNDGVYREMIPRKLHEACLYDSTPEGLAGAIQDSWHFDRPANTAADFAKKVKAFDAITACKLMDERLTEAAAKLAKK
jgi:hypothetical protein